MKAYFLIAAKVFWGDPSDVQRNDVLTNPYGGEAQEAGMEVELLVSDREVALSVYSSDKLPLDTQRYNASIDIVTGGNREQSWLHSREPQSVVGKSSALLRTHSTMMLCITTPTGVRTGVAF